MAKYQPTHYIPTHPAELEKYEKAMESRGTFEEDADDDGDHKVQELPDDDPGPTVRDIVAESADAGELALSDEEYQRLEDAASGIDKSDAPSRKKYQADPLLRRKSTPSESPVPSVGSPSLLETTEPKPTDSMGTDARGDILMV